MTGDVFKEAPARADLADDAGDVRPKVAGIVLPEAVTGKRKGLAGITGSDEMNAVAPRPAIEGSQIVPDRSRCQGRVCHPRHESGRSETVSLDITHSPVSGFGEVQAKVEPADPGAEAEAKDRFRLAAGT